jgi:voltage-gated potassium channel
MELMYDFVRLFVLGLTYVSPLLLSLILIIIVLGLIIGKREGWTGSNAVYFAFITATTVGFGDFHPERKLSKLLSIVIAMVGLIFTGIVIALALHAASEAFKHSPEFTKAIHKTEQIEQAP